MPRLAIIGGSVVGSAAALLFARSGWQVTVVDPELELFGCPAPELAPRPGAPHTVQAHAFIFRGTHELSTRLPDVMAALTEAGAGVVPLSELAPPPLYDGGRPDDGELRALRVRRITLDRVLAESVRAEPGVERLVATVSGLLLEPGTPPRVRGLGLADGSSVEADLVLDAGGRRSPVTRWLAEAGHPVVERADRCGAKYYTRHFRVEGSDLPPLNRGFLEGHEFPSFLQLLFLGDNHTAMLALAVHDADPVFKLARAESVHTALAQANPALAPWMAVLEPTSPVFALGSLDNRMRSLVRDGRPVVLGLHQVGDSLSTTNPTRGRGISMGLASVGALHDLVSAGSDESTALAFEAWRAGVLETYYRECAVGDTVLGAKLRASFDDVPVPANAPAVELPADHPLSWPELERVCSTDPDLFRVMLRANGLLDDHRHVSSPEVTERALRLRGALPDPPAPAAPPTGDLHDRARLEELILSATAPRAH